MLFICWFLEDKPESEDEDEGCYDDELEFSNLQNLPGNIISEEQDANYQISHRYYWDYYF